MILKANKLQKSFGPLHVIGNISFELQPGEIVAILGASGCGKTTLLRLLLGAELSDGGTIESSLQRPGPRIGYQAQSSQARDQLLPWRTIRDNVALGPELLGVDKKMASNRANTLLQQVGLGAFVQSRPRDLSGGMLQRALLARTLALKPRLLLLDEPMSNLDIIARQELGATTRSYVNDTQSAALLVTHSVEEACQVADRVMIISQKPATILHEIAVADWATAMPQVQRALVDSIKGRA